MIRQRLFALFLVALVLGTGLAHASAIWKLLRRPRPSPADFERSLSPFTDQLRAEKTIGFVGSFQLFGGEKGDGAPSFECILARYALAPASVLSPRYGVSEDRAARVRALFTADPLWRSQRSVLFFARNDRTSEEIEQVLKELGFREVSAARSRIRTRLYRR